MHPVHNQTTMPTHEGRDRSGDAKFGGTTMQASFANHSISFYFFPGPAEVGFPASSFGPSPVLQIPIPSRHENNPISLWKYAKSWPEACQEPARCTPMHATSCPNLGRQQDFFSLASSLVFQLVLSQCSSSLGMFAPKLALHPIRKNMASNPCA